MANIKERTVYTGTFIHCKSLGTLEILSDTAIGVDEKGTIAFISSTPSIPENLARLDWSPSTTRYTYPASSKHITFFFPGFLDTHIHASQHPNAGIFGKTTLLSWLEKYTFPLEASLSDPHKAQLVYKTCVKTTLAHGTTTAAYYATISTPSTTILAQTCLDLGQRAFIGRCAMDNPDFQPAYYRDPDSATAIQESLSSALAIKALDPTHLVQPIITPRFALSCTEPTLRGLATIATHHSLPIQTHISENVAEIALVAKHFPSHPSYTALYHACGLLGPRTILAHACHLTPADLDLVKSTRTNISHCPVSNTFLGSGLCPVRELLDADITVGLGSDMSGGYSPSILVAAREAGAVSRMRTAPGVSSSSPSATSTGTEEVGGNRDFLKLTIEETLYLATRGGAKCLGLENLVGGFEVGKEWDVQMVDLGAELGLDTSDDDDDDDDDDDTATNGISNVQIWAGIGWEERIAKWLHLGDDRNVVAVWVRGRLVGGRGKVG